MTQGSGVSQRACAKGRATARCARQAARRQGGGRAPRNRAVSVELEPCALSASEKGGGRGDRARSQAAHATCEAARGAPSIATVDRRGATVSRHVPAAPIEAAERVHIVKEMEIEPSITRARRQEDEREQSYDAGVSWGQSAGVR